VRTQSCQNTNLELFHTPKLWENKFLWFKPLSLWYFVMETQENKLFHVYFLRDSLAGYRIWGGRLLFFLSSLTLLLYCLLASLVSDDRSDFMGSLNRQCWSSLMLVGASLGSALSLQWAWVWMSLYFLCLEFIEVLGPVHWSLSFRSLQFLFLQIFFCLSFPLLQVQELGIVPWLDIVPWI
jgi:hypothetical protein